MAKKAAKQTLSSRAPDGAALHLFIGDEERDRALAVYGAAIEPQISLGRMPLAIDAAMPSAALVRLTSR